jgi:hypothetical protein
MFKQMMALAFVFGAAAAAPPLHAQEQAFCAPRDVIAEKLTKDYGEALSAAGLQSASQLVEVWSDPASGTWTIFVTSPTGMACVVASGENWHMVQPAVMPDGPLS